MKVLLKKLKRKSKFKTILYKITTLLYIISLIYFTINIVKLSGVATVYRIIALAFFWIYSVIYLIATPVAILINKKLRFFLLTFVSIIFSTLFILSSYGLNIVLDGIAGLNKTELVYTSNLITLTDTEFDKNSTIGKIDDEEDLEGYQLANKLYKEEELANQVVKYEDYYQMLEALYNNEVDSIFVSGNYTIFFEGEEQFKNIKTETKIIYTYSEKLENIDLNTGSGKQLTEPFSILIMGVDSELEGLDASQAFNGDTLILMTFNPDTLGATMVSIARDTIVPIACRDNAIAKINASAAYGTDCVIDTVENVTNTPIDYYLKLNFKAVVDIVDALGGITVDIEVPDYNWNDGTNCNGQVCEQNSERKWGEDTVYIDTGVQHIDGEQALAYARCRHLYIESDFARNRHQQQIIEATAKELMEIKSISEIEQLINSISDNMETNMDTKTMLSSYEVGLDIILNTNITEGITINKAQLEYYNLPIILPGTSIATSGQGYYEESMEAISTAMRINLGLEEQQVNKSFTIDYNEDYETKVIGQGLYGGSKIITMPNMVGKTMEEAQTWAQNNGLLYETLFINSDHAYYNPNGLPGLISNQSIKSGTNIQGYTSITYYINNTN